MGKAGICGWCILGGKKANFSSIGYMSHVTGDETWRSRFSHSSPKLWADLASSSRANRPGCTIHFILGMTHDTRYSLPW